MNSLDHFLREHHELTRRYFLRLGAAGAAAAAWPKTTTAAQRPPQLAQAIEKLESYLTPPEAFSDVSRGNPIPHTLPEEKKKEVGLTRETWSLEVVSDPDHKANIRNPLTKENGKALDFKALMQLAEKHAVRFPKVMTCLNIGCPLGMGIWEGVPLRDIFWLTQPRRDVRRVYYHGYHNDDPQQIFRSSLSLDRVLEDPFDLPPVIVCYKLNGQWLSAKRGGPARIVVPEAYGFKSVKWLQQITLTNLHHANDTYAKGNNDVDSRLKSFAATLSVAAKAKAGVPMPVTGYAQVGISGVSKVQVWIHSDDEPLPKDDKYFATAPWRDAEILGPPAKWGGGLPNDKMPPKTMGIDPQTGKPTRWPMRLSKIHWAILLPGLSKGKYTLRSRTIDERGQAQPMPRPFRKSGHAAIEQVSITVEA